MRYKFQFIIIIALIFIFSINKSLYSQNSICDYFYRNMLKSSDSIGKYDINVFVVGVVKIDSLINVSYKTRIRKKLDKWEYSSYFITSKNNINFIKIHENDIDNLIYQKEYFELEVDVNVVKYFIYPQCDRYEKLQLDKLFEDNKDCRLNILYGDKINIKDRVSYREIKGNNKFLLVIMNRTWRQNRFFKDDNTKTDNTNTYVKYLVPLGSISDLELSK